jgi:hypothetical protein
MSTLIFLVLFFLLCALIREVLRLRQENEGMVRVAALQLTMRQWMYRHNMPLMDQYDALEREAYHYIVERGD